jgi:hypothetical protein
LKNSIRQSNVAIGNCINGGFDRKIIYIYTWVIFAMFYYRRVYRIKIAFLVVEIMLNTYKPL